VFLLVLTSILGGMAGFGVGIIRMVTSGPTWAVAIGVSLAAAAYGGAGIVHTDGVDFRLLEPLSLTVGLFVLIPGCGVRPLSSPPNGSCAPTSKVFHPGSTAATGVRADGYCSSASRRSGYEASPPTSPR
jgi:hypothetical protein